ncbi:MAG: hypothetical protein AAF650_10335 [Pseudomonadota bacterium]
MMPFRLTKPREKWFFLIVLPIAIAIEWAFALSLDWSAYPRSEWVALVDLCVFMPIVYIGLFSSELSAKTRGLRALGIAGIGLFAASWIVPSANQFLISELASLRAASFVFVLAFEGFVFWKVMQALYTKNADAKAIERDFAVPPFIAKLLVLEAKFWKAVWRLFRRK